MMKQLTLRGFERKIERQIREVARKENISLNKAALRLITRGAESTRESSAETIGHSLDEFIGDWTDAEADAMRKSAEIFEVIDAEDWK